MPYTDKASVKTYLDITDADDDDLIDELIDRAQAIIEARTARVFEWPGAATAQTFDALEDTALDKHGARRDLLFYQVDLCSITSIVNGDGETVGASSYVTLPRNVTPYYGIRLKGSSGLVWEYEDDPEGAIVVTGKWAYSVTAPADIVHAAVRMAAYLYRQKDTQQVFEQVMASASGVLQMPSKLPSDIIDILGPYT
ncbi:MAG: phage head-tail connector protein, partial [Anaerolineae bacterium]|nr:phage head-tail connector protein [Anaerolineae bacterium]